MNRLKGSFTIEAVLISNIMLFFIVAVVNTMLTVYDNNIVDMVISDTIVFIESNDYNEDNKDIIDDYIKQKLERKIIFLEF